MKYLFALTTIVFLFINKPCIGQTIKINSDKSKSTISYDMVHPLHQWTGISKDLTSIIVLDQVKNEIIQVAVKAKVASFDSQNANRDSHMIEVAEGLKFPDVTFVSNKIQNNGDQLTVTGTINFHGVGKALTLTCNRKDSKNEIEVSGNFRVNQTDFNIPPPSLLGVSTEDEFGISFRIVYPLQKK
jgi:polyisoprenoid-binding protein YceI